MTEPSSHRFGSDLPEKARTDLVQSAWAKLAVLKSIYPDFYVRQLLREQQAILAEEAPPYSDAVVQLAATILGAVESTSRPIRIYGEASA